MVLNILAVFVQEYYKLSVDCSPQMTLDYYELKYINLAFV